MNYQVLARKWRPQQFKEIIGQDTVVRTLQNAISSNRIAHAFLFSGIRGVGKTTTARVLSKALNCQKGLNQEPCRKCVVCLEIASSNSIDVLEIDAASNTGVDSIRNLRESVRYGTSRDRFKIFIIDEVHMLSKQAFNALLKTLEEPPAHVKFILATTELEKIPATIRSRCQHFIFKPISFLSLLKRLKEISDEEGIEISDHSLRMVVSQAEGSMRDAQSSLDQIISFAGKKVKDEDVRTLLGLVDDRLVTAVLGAISKNNKKGLFLSVDNLRDGGVDPQSFCQKFLRYLRNLMVFKVVGWEEKLLNLPSTAHEALADHAEEFSRLDLIRFYDLIQRVERELRWHSHPYVHLEMALMGLVELSRLPLVEEVLTKLESKADLKNPVVATHTEIGKHSKVSGSRLSPKVSRQEEPKIFSQPAEGKETKPRKQEMSVPVRAIVPDLLSAVQLESPSLYHSMERATEKSFHEDKLLFRFSKSESFHQELLLTQENQEIVSRLCAEITGAVPQITVELVETDEIEVDLTEDPRVQDFIRAFPGQVTVQRKARE